MCWRKPTRSKQLLSVATGLAAIVIAAACAGSTHAGILLPKPINFDAKDLDRSLSSNQASGSSSTSPNDSRTWPANEDDQRPSPLGLLKAPLPTDGASSSSSSSSTGGATGSGVAVCLLNARVLVADDLALGRIAEDRGLSLPAPPGTELLRPPQS